MLDPSTPAARRRAHDVGFLVVLLVLAASIPSFMHIPFLPPWPLDFQNLWAFHDCAARNQPYAVSGVACGDARGRDMLYPPLLYWSFAWTRWLTFRAASEIWTVLVAIGTVGATLAWIPRSAWHGSGGARTAIFAALLLAQFPLLFAVERGNNDVVVLVLWTVAALVFRRGSPGAAGAIAALGAVLKLYPVFACVVVGTGLVVRAVRSPPSRRTATTFAIAGVVVTLLAIAVAYPQTVVYATRVVPAIARNTTPLTHYGHALSTLWPLWSGWALALPLLVAWCAAAALVIHRDPVLVFAGALGISTFFASTTWDYNLITTYPLLVVLFARAMRSTGVSATVLLVVGLVAIVGHRGLFAGNDSALRLHVALQWAFLVGVAVAAPWIAAREDTSVPSARAEALPATPGSIADA